MKYSVLVALLGVTEAKHHHHRLAQLTTPDESRAAWDTTRNTSWAVAAEQQRFQAEHNAMVAKNFDDDTNATNAQKNHVRKDYNKMTIGANSFAQTSMQSSDPLGKANGTFVKGKAEAEEVVANQQAFENDHTTMVKSNYSKDTAQTNSLKESVSDGYVKTLNGSNGYLPPIKGSAFVQLEGDDEKSGSTLPAAPFGNANDQFVKNKPLEAKVVATQQAYEAAKEADVDARNEANKASSASLFGHVTRARDVQAQGGFWHEPYQRRAQWAGRPDATFLQLEKPKKDPLGAANGSHTKGVAEAEEVIANQKEEEDASTAEQKSNEDKYADQASAEKKVGNGYVEHQAAGGVKHNSYPKAAPFPNSFVQEEPAAAKPAEEATAAAPKEGEVKPEGKENQAKSPGPKDKLGWANQTKKEGLSESAEVVKKQQAAEGVVEKENKENDDQYTDEANAKKAGVLKEYDTQAQGGVKQEVYPTNGWHYDKKNFAYLQMQDNEADVEFLKGKAIAAGVTATQQAFEAKKTADVETRNDKDSKQCLDLRTQVVTTHETRLKSFDANVQMVYIPEQDIFLGLY